MTVISKLVAPSERSKWKEPLKHEKNAKGHWVITKEWKEWSRKRKATETKPKPKVNKSAVTAENHQTAWKEVAYHPDTGKRIYFCACMSMHGDAFRGCGAVGVQQTRTSAIIEMLGSRFE